MPDTVWGQLHIGATTPADAQVQVGSLWTDTATPALKRCTSISPITFVSTEGGSAAHNILSATHSDAFAGDVPANNDVLTWVAANSRWEAVAGGGGTNHNLLSATHPDTLTASPVRGDILRGNTTPAWSRLAIGTAGQVVRSDGADPSWATLSHGDLTGVTSDQHQPRSHDHSLVADGQTLAALLYRLDTGDTTLTIATGRVTRAQSYHSIDTEAAAASDDLAGIAGGVDGDILFIRPANDARTVVVKHEGTEEATLANRINLNGDADHSLDDQDDFLLLVYDTGIARWLEVARGTRRYPDLAERTHGNADHTTGVAPADVTKAAAAEGTSAAVARADHKHDITTATAGASAVADTAAEGTATTLSRSDHRHSREAFGSPTGQIDIGDAQSDGTATTLPRSDHQHAFPAPAAAYPVDVAATEADGTATTVARSDHRHAHGSGYLADAHHAQAHTIDGADHTGVLTIAKGGTGLSAVPKVEVVISAASLKGTTTAGAGDANKLPESAELPVNLVNYDYLAFDQTTSENAFFQYSVPKGWDEGTLTFRVKWTATGGTVAQGVVFGLKALARSDDDALDAAWGTEITVTDSLLAISDLHISPESAALTVGGTPIEGDTVFFNIARKTADVSDTLAADARLIEIIVTYTRASYTD